MITPPTPKILILGGYGVFGRKIAELLSLSPNAQLFIAGRDMGAATRFCEAIKATPLQLDIHSNLEDVLKQLNPFLVINCCGPFQGQDYSTAMTCIKNKSHYIDLADSREYVAHFKTALDSLAKAHQVTAITGASTVPAISSSVIDHFLAHTFSEIHSLDYGVSPGNQTDRGVATVAAILSYVGKPFKTLLNGEERVIYGWQDLHRTDYPQLGKRWMANCDIPDLTLFPDTYPHLKTLRFFAGLELSLLHVGLWLLSWFSRFKIVSNYASHAALFRRISLVFYPYGTAKGGMHMTLKGVDNHDRPKTICWYILAENGDGPYIPAAPSVLVANKILWHEISESGAFACMGYFKPAELFDLLKNRSVYEVIR